MRKVSLIISHSDIVNVISELMSLECVEPIEPEVVLDPPELTDLVRREVMELDDYDANLEALTVLTTQYTYTIVGWVPDVYESELAEMLSGFTCSFHFADPLPHEVDLLPAFIKYPQVFGRLRSSGRKVFEPLSKRVSL